MNEKDNSYEDDLYYVNDGLTIRPLTSSHHVGDFIEESDHSILFKDHRQKDDEPQKGEKKTVYYRLSLGGGEAVKAYEFFTALKILGIETRAVLFKEGNHGLSVRGKKTHRFKRP